MTSEAARREQARERERERKGKGKARAGPSQSLALAQPGRDAQQQQRAGQRRSQGETWAERVRADLERRSKLAAHAHANGRMGAGPGATGETVGAVGSGSVTASGLGGEVGGMRPSDEAEYARFVVRWEPVSDWLGISVPREPGDELDLQVVCPC